MVSESGVSGHYHFVKLDISANLAFSSLFQKYDFDVVINLAAQAGVRYSLENPKAYVYSGLVGFVNILEGCRNNKV